VDRAGTFSRDVRENVGGFPRLRGDADRDDLDGPDRTATSNQTLNGAKCHAGAFAVHLYPDLVFAPDLRVGVPHAFDLRQQLGILLPTGGDA
jgi:hypothetical protein